jgi:hypothetical protein
MHAGVSHEPSMVRRAVSRSGPGRMAVTSRYGCTGYMNLENVEHNWRVHMSTTILGFIKDEL